MIKRAPPSVSRSIRAAVATTPVFGVDGEISAVIIDEAIRDSAMGGIAIGSMSGNANKRSDGYILVKRVGQRIEVDQRRCGELIEVIDGDGVGLIGEGTIGRGGSDSNASAGS